MGRPSKSPMEFRREAVEHVGSSDRTIAEVARSLGISDGTLGNWVKADRERRERDADPTPCRRPCVTSSLVCAARQPS